MHTINTLLAHPAVNIVVGAAMILTGIDAALEDWGIEKMIPMLGLHHGIMLAGLTQGLRGIFDALEGAKRMQGEAPPA